MIWQEERGVLALDQMGAMQNEQICRGKIEISGCGSHIIIGWFCQTASCSLSALKPELRLTWLRPVAMLGEWTTPLFTG